MTGKDHTVTEGDKLLVSVARRTRAWLAALLGASLMITGGALALPAVLGRVVDAAISRTGTGGIWLAACALLVAVFAVSETATVASMGVANANATARLRDMLLTHVLRVGHRLPERGGDTVSRITANASDAGGGPASVVAAAAAIIPPVGALVALALIDPWLAAAFAVSFPALALLLRGLARDSSAIAAGYGRVQGAIAVRLLDALAGARTIAAAGTQDSERRRILAPLPELRGYGHATWRVQGRAAAQSTVIAPVLQAVVVGVAGLELARHHLTPGGLAAASQYAVLATGIGASTAIVAQLGLARGAARRVAELLAIPVPRYGNSTLSHRGGPEASPRGIGGRAAPQPQEGPGAGINPSHRGRPEASPRGHGGRAAPHSQGEPGGDRPPAGAQLSIRGVTVRRGGRAVLRGLDLTVPGGAAVAIVGRSGAGKSTLAELAGRLADPDEGSVSLDGAELRGLSRTALREAVVYAFERPYPFGATPREAIGFGPADVPGPAIAEAAAAAQAASFLDRLPRGYDTPLEEVPLSGGEMQRLGLARAFAHAGAARLLILDDATSSLDTVTEMLVSEAITQRLRGRTRLIVAHRAATAARADLVAWLDGGRVRALAPHDHLWPDPDYRALWGTPDGKKRRHIGRKPRQYPPGGRPPVPPAC